MKNENNKEKITLLIKILDICKRVSWSFSVINLNIDEKSHWSKKFKFLEKVHLEFYCDQFLIIKTKDIGNISGDYLIQGLMEFYLYPVSELVQD